MRKPNLVLALSVLAACTGGTNDVDDAGVGSGSGSGDRPPITRGVSTLAGWSQGGYMDGPRETNLFNNPVNLAYGPDGKVYVADFDNFKIRTLDMKGNAETVIAQEGFARPFGLVFVGGTLYVGTDRDPDGNGGPNNLMAGTIWKVDITAKIATPVAPRIGRPRGLAALADGRIAVADYNHHVIEIFDPASGAVTPLAGSWDTAGFADGVGAAAQFSTPYALAQLDNGKLLVTDWGNHRLRLVALDGTVTTVAGDGTAGFADGAASSAKLNHPQGLVKVDSGDLYMTDTDNYRVRKIAADLSTISTYAGDGTPGYKDSTDRLAAEFYGLEGITANGDGSLIFVADGSRGENVPYNRIRVIKN